MHPEKSRSAGPSGRSLESEGREAPWLPQVDPLPELPPVVMVHPARARGKVHAPPSKSYTHRAFVVALLAESPTRVIGALRSADTIASLGAVAALGGKLEVPYVVPERDRRRTTWLPSITVQPPSERKTGEAISARRPSSNSPGPVQVEVGESGTTLRLFTAVAARGSEPVRFEGSPSLARRPMAPLLGALKHLGASVQTPSASTSLPLVVQGPIRPGTVSVSGAESSQFTSALLMVLPLLPGASRLQVDGPRVSEPYVEATLSVMEAQGVHVERDGPAAYRVPGGQRYEGGDLFVPGDASSAAYFLALGAITGGPLTVGGLYPDPPQADLALLPVLRDAGAQVVWAKNEGEVEVERSGPRLERFEADLDPSPDLAPLLAVLAAFAHGRSLLRGGAHLAGKESDRRQGMIGLAKALGARVRELGAGLEIEGPVSAKRLDLVELDDHRMVMSAAVAAAGLAEPSSIGDARAVLKSHPGFFDDLTSLGIASAARGARPSVAPARSSR